MKNIKDLIFVYNDTETTGTEEEDRIIETAHLKIQNGKLLEHIEELCNPGVRIKAGAAMTHGYRNSDIQGKPEFKKLISKKSLKEMSKNPNCYYVAHNAPFDLAMLEKEGITWNKNRVIDTLQIAKHVYKDRENFDNGHGETIEMMKLQYFRFFYEEEFEKLEKVYMKKVGITHIQPHTALSDILVLWIFAEKLMKDFNLSVEKMVELSHKLSIEETITFGKKFEKGTPYEDIITAPYMKFGKKTTGIEYILYLLDKPKNEDDRKDRMSLSLEREYGMYHAIGKSVLNDRLHASEYYLKCLNYAVAFSFEKQDIVNAMVLQGFTSKTKIIAVYKKLISNIINKMETENENYLTKEELIQFDANEFEKNQKIIAYLKDFRKDYLKPEDFDKLTIKA